MQFKSFVYILAILLIQSAYGHHEKIFKGGHIKFQKPQLPSNIATEIFNKFALKGKLTTTTAEPTLIILTPSVRPALVPSRPALVPSRPALVPSWEIGPDTTSGTSSSAIYPDTTSGTSSSAVYPDTTSGTSSSETGPDITSGTSSSETGPDTTSATSETAVGPVTSATSSTKPGLDLTSSSKGPNEGSITTLPQRPSTFPEQGEPVNPVQPVETFPDPDISEPYSSRAANEDDFLNDDGDEEKAITNSYLLYGNGEAAKIISYNGKQHLNNNKYRYVGLKNFSDKVQIGRSSSARPSNGQHRNQLRRRRNQQSKRRGIRPTRNGAKNQRRRRNPNRKLLNRRQSANLRNRRKSTQRRKLLKRRKNPRHQANLKRRQQVRNTNRSKQGNKRVTNNPLHHVRRRPVQRIIIRQLS